MSNGLRIGCGQEERRRSVGTREPREASDRGRLWDIPGKDGRYEMWCGLLDQWRARYGITRTQAAMIVMDQYIEHRQDRMRVDELTRWDEHEDFVRMILQEGEAGGLDRLDRNS